MAIITDEPHESAREYYLACMGEKYIFRKSDFIIENSLYRYRSEITWALEEIRTGQVYLSKTDCQNDPFDSSYAMDDNMFFEEEYPIDMLLQYISAYLKTQVTAFYDKWSDYCEKALDHSISIGNFIQEFSKYTSTSETYVKQALKLTLGSYNRRHNFDYKIACFSETSTSIPMWAYYANNHKGVCLKYDMSRLNTTAEEIELKKAFCKIHYSDYRPKDLHGDYSMIVKSSQWAHEHEWRIICKTKENFIIVPCLSAVYLGINFDYQYFDDITSAIKENGNQIDLYYSVANQEKYELDYRLIRL